ncbi:ROK family transcriptional regulator [Nakamurella sp. A5-74]|uniref:ROK family transcriptional regulator n=1 Tax=Nakamurella sp. A5-74 TaxID=3158264 RepID=A0AAU8DUA6_9ACTN
MNSSASAPGSQSGLRESNRLRVVQALQTHGAMTQVEIAGTTGLSPATVSNLVKDLDAADAVVLEPSIRNGRRAVLVSLPRARELLAGIAFGDRDVRVAIGTGPRELTGSHRMPLPPEHRADEGMERAAELLLDLIDTAGMTRADISALTIGVPAPINSATGRVGADDILPGWSGVDVGREMRTLLGAPVLVENTANLAAVGELKLGALQGVETGVYLKISHGVGAGLIIGGELFRGSAGTAGEIGHLTIDERGPVCRCGNRGCLETYVGSRAFQDALVRTHGTLTLRDVVTRVGRGDAACHRVIEDAGRYLGMAVAGLVNLINPEVVVLGGQLSRVADVVLGPMRAALDRCAVPSAAAAVDLRASTLEANADIIGALALSEIASSSAASAPARTSDR